jgi:hypothetical protein
MKKPGVLLVLAVLEALALALGALFWFRMRPELLAAYGAGAGSMTGLPWATATALSSWFAPGVGAAGGACVLIGLLLRARTRTRVTLAAVGLVETAFGLSFAVLAAYAPVFDGLGRG